MIMSDYRIGNWISDYEVDPDKTTYFQIEEIKKVKSSLGVVYRNGSVWNGDEESLAIPLTEDWLVDKFGAEEHTGTPFFNVIMPRNIGFISINPNNHVTWLKHHNTDSSLNVESVKYVNQLQNLYFSLTGEELTIKG